MAVWKLYAWPTPRGLVRHWVDPEQANAWAASAIRAYESRGWLQFWTSAQQFAASANLGGFWPHTRFALDARPMATAEEYIAAIVRSGVRGDEARAPGDLQIDPAWTALPATQRPPPGMGFPVLPVSIVPGFSPPASYIYPGQNAGGVWTPRGWLSTTALLMPRSFDGFRAHTRDTYDNAAWERDVLRPILRGAGDEGADAPIGDLKRRFAYPAGAFVPVPVGRLWIGWQPIALDGAWRMELFYGDVDGMRYDPLGYDPASFVEYLRRWLRDGPAVLTELHADVLTSNRRVLRMVSPQMARLAEGAAEETDALNEAAAIGTATLQRAITRGTLFANEADRAADEISGVVLAAIPFVGWIAAAIKEATLQVAVHIARGNASFDATMLRQYMISGTFGYNAPAGQAVAQSRPPDHAAPAPTKFTRAPLTGWPTPLRTEIVNGTGETVPYSWLRLVSREFGDGGGGGGGGSSTGGGTGGGVVIAGGIALAIAIALAMRAKR